MNLRILNLMIILLVDKMWIHLLWDGLCLLFHLKHSSCMAGKRPDGTRSNVPMMIPLIDMCNHSFDPNAEIVQEEENSNRNMLVKVVSGREIKQNDPLLLNYGCLSSNLFLLDYGFVIPSNPYDCIELKYDAALLDAASMAAGVSSPNFSSPSPWQQQILSHLNLYGPNTDLKVTLGGGELVEGRLLAALRVVLSNDVEEVKQKYRIQLNLLIITYNSIKILYENMIFSILL